ncbi:MAG: hypothetical protein WC159_08100 [Sphaerochaetaceae bacterium]
MKRVENQYTSSVAYQALSLYALDYGYQGMTDRALKARINSGAFYEPPQRG